MSAAKYNKIRRILFCTANDPSKGFSCAYDYFHSTYRWQLSPQSSVGLMAELKFYQNFMSEYKLTVAGDMGEHADFSGMLDGVPVRFDVTTNLDYKKFKDYEPFMGKGIKYKIALYDKINFQIIDILELRFERCNCGGYMLPFILMKTQNYNRHGVTNFTNDQMLMKICTECQDVSEHEIFTHYSMNSPSEISQELPEEMSLTERDLTINNYTIDIYKSFRRDYSDDIMAIAENICVPFGNDGDGYWSLNYGFVNSAIADEIPYDVQCGPF